MSGNPYRTPLPRDGKAPPASMAYVVNRGATRPKVVLQAVLLAWAAAGLANIAGYRSLALPILYGALAWGTWKSWRVRGVGGVVLSVAQGRLEVTSRRKGAALLYSVLLSELEDVMLDTKAISKVLRGRSVIPWLGLANSTVAPAVDVTRIVLVPSGTSRPFALSDEHIDYQDGVQGIGTVRRFLRGHGWVPADERAG